MFRAKTPKRKVSGSNPDGDATFFMARFVVLFNAEFVFLGLSC